MISKKTARKMYNFYTERIDQLIQAQTSLTSGGVKSYKIGDMEITKLDMDKLSNMLEEAVAAISKTAKNTFTNLNIFFSFRGVFGNFSRLPF